MYFVGIYIAKRFHEAAVIDEQGKIIVKRIKFQNSHAGYCKLMDAVRKTESVCRVCNGGDRTLLV